jgi:undecaprenyl-diphosphatase
VSDLTYPEATVIGLLQGVTELFPVSSLGHSVLLPALIGGRWARDLDVSAPESPYLAFIVGLHVATAAALLLFFWRDWLRIIGGFLSSVRTRRVTTADQRLAWLIVLATIPVGISGLLLEHLFRTVLGRPVPAASFLIANGLVLLAGERLRRQPATGPVPSPATTARVTTGPAVPTTPGAPPPPASPGPTSGSPVAGAVSPGSLASGDPVASDAAAGGPDAGDGVAADRRLASLGTLPALLIGAAQTLALLPGISRSGITMVAGLTRGLSHEDAARFSFLLATPVILAAGVLKLPDLTGPLGAGIHGQLIIGSLASGVSAYLSVRYLTRYFTTRTLTPFAIYCLCAGAAGLAVLAAR